ncbi:hypothetical protein Tco_0910942 [Tanacetum coccineum]|uniref:Uncharacterized protein n=1 Tax=Tanacetum coccineum TaxID=301880 RepID=A0ABQ5CW11_9ASTR
MSVENVSLGLVPQGQKASDYDNSDPVPPRQNVVPSAEKTDSSQPGLEFLFSPLLEEYYNPTHGLAEEKYPARTFANQNTRKSPKDASKEFKDNSISLNKLNALKTTIQHLSSSNHSMYYEFREAFHRLFDANEGLFRSVLSRNMQNLEMQFSNETLHEKDSNSELRAIKGQFEHFIHSKMFELSKYNTNAREILQDFNAYTTMEAQTFKETIIQNMDSIAQCMVERASHEQELKMTLKRLNESQEVLPAESSSTDMPLEQVQNNDENNVFANERQYTAECTDERVALANLIANLTLDTEENKTIIICTNDNQENKTIQKQLKKANASLTQELRGDQIYSSGKLVESIGESNIDFDKLEHKLKMKLRTIAQKGN